MDDHLDLVRELVAIARRLTALVVVLADRFGPAHRLTHRGHQALRSLERLRAEVIGHDELERGGAS